MEDNEFEETLKMLSYKVDQFNSSNKVKNKNKSNSVKSLLPNIFVKSSYIYFGIIPLIIGLILFFWKPNFVMKEKVAEEEISAKKKLSFNKLIVTTAIFTTVFIFSIYIYIYISNKSKA